MNPILLAAIQKLLAAEAKAKQQGVAFHPTAIDAFLKEETGGKFGYPDFAKLQEINGSNLMRSGMNASSFNLADDAISLFSPEQANESRVRTRVFSDAHPVADAGAGLIAALGTGHGLTKLLPFLAGLGEAKTVGQAVLRGAGTGAGYGALSSAGAADDGTITDRLSAASRGAVTGAVAGGVLAGGVAGARALYSPTVRAARRLGDAVTQSGGVPTLRAKVAELAANGRGDVATLGDLSPEMKQAADFAANNNDQALIGLTKVLKTRQTDQTGRLLNDVQTTLGDNPNASARQAALVDSRRQWADGASGYGGLRDANPSFDLSSLSSALNKPTVRSAWRQARLGGDLVENSPLDKMIQKLAASNPGKSPDEIRAAAEYFTNAAAQDAGKVGAVQGSRPVTFDDLQQLVRALRGRAKSAWLKGDGASGSAYTTIADAATNALEEGSPGFKAVNAEYAQRKGLESALQAGQDAWSVDDPRSLGEQMAGMKGDALAQFRYGMASKLVAQLRSAATNRDVARQLLDRSQALDEKLKLAFGDRATFESFMSRVKSEGDLSGLKGAVGGSQTARRLQAAGYDPAEMGIDALAHPGGLAMQLLRAGSHAAKGVLARGTARQMTPWLLTQGATNIDALLRQVGQPAPLVGARATIAAPMGLTSLFDHQDQR